MRHFFKTAVILVLMLLTANPGSAQITTRTVADPAKQTKTADEVNFLGESPQGYLNQDLFLAGLSEKLRMLGWRDFCKKLPCKITSKTIEYGELAGKYFTVTSVDRNTADPGFSAPYILTLKEKESGQIWYYRYSDKFEHLFPFISVRYFEAQKKAFTGRKFISRGSNYWTSDGIVRDMNTGAVVDFSPGTLWECADVTIESKHYSVVLVLKNDKGAEIPFPIDRIQSPEGLWSLSDAEQIKKKYGSDVYNLIVQRKVRLGMTEEQVRLSWGEPKRINTSVYEGLGETQQWVYENNYLYFQNGKLRAKQ